MQKIRRGAHHRPVSANPQAPCHRLGHGHSGTMAVELQADRALVVELHQLLSEIDPVRWRDEAAVALRGRLEKLQRGRTGHSIASRRQ